MKVYGSYLPSEIALRPSTNRVLETKGERVRCTECYRKLAEEENSARARQKTKRVHTRCNEETIMINPVYVPLVTKGWCYTIHLPFAYCNDYKDDDQKDVRKDESHLKIIKVLKFIPTHLPNTQMFLDHLRCVKPNNSHVMESFDVTSLYTNVLSNSAMQAIFELLTENEEKLILHAMPCVSTIELNEHRPSAQDLTAATKVGRETTKEV
ncbi:hypothetical protein KIN20_001648 [Parelaphostrongylus tenuis]|uniref:Reverse transcriptase domain-containing protein n=1 Tax=Parelaphostrongylus tenuis TaxID=148309 RepID=A0AAD5QH68_PARTN|nr:hypothetical protein KIN20_001648 [Parelaphostrongylus tenuis]